MLSDLFHNQDILTFENCQTDFNNPPSEHFHYIQLKHWALHPRVRDAATRELTPIESFVKKVGATREVISQLYGLLVSTTPTSSPRYLSSWERTLGREIMKEE